MDGDGPVWYPERKSAEERDTMAENIRRKIPVLVLAAVVLFTAWMLWPRSLAGR